MGRLRLLSSVFLASWISVTAQAESGADAIFSNLGGDGTEESELNQGIKLRDPFAVQFYSEWQVQKNLPYELNAWAQKVLKGDHANVAHLWTVIQPQVPGDFQNAVKGAFLYSLWNLDVPQTFFDNWLAMLADKRFSESRVAMALDQTIGPKFSSWLTTHAIQLTPEQAAQVAKLPAVRGPHYVTLQAWALLRSGRNGSDVLAALPAGHALKIPLAQTVTLAQARAGDLKGAASVLKKHMEPAIEAAMDKDALARHYITVARLLYQAGALEAAEVFYERIPNGSPDFLQAREELLWVWLRQGNLTKLRGELATFGTDLFENKFAPDIYVVRAVSNLKMCFYDEVEKDLAEFVESNRKWAKKIEEALKAPTPPAPASKDRFALLADRQVQQRERELSRLAKLAEESIAASLPAVGPQKHWEQAQKRLMQSREIARKNQAQEYRRQWSNDSAILKEAIQKMRFVKIEFMSQVRELSRRAGDSSPSLDEAAVQQAITKQRREVLKTGENEITFPFDGVVWPDELFRIRSVAQAQCLKGTQE